MTVQACREVLARKSRSFALAAALLPASVGDDAAVVYAFCRRADDAIDVGPASAATLQQLRLEVASIYAGTPQDDGQLRAFQDVVRRRAIPRAYVDELIDGMEMDVQGARYRTLDDLLVYCHRVAGTVGLMMCHVMGVRSPLALRRAAHLGMAMQLTNICRDVAEDWGNGRLYLPVSTLGRGGPCVAAGPFPDGLRVRAGHAIAVLLEEADRYYRSADGGIAMLGWRCALAVRTARLVYAAIGDRVRMQDPLAGRAVVPLWRKLFLLGKALFHGLAGLSFTFPAPRPPELVLRFPDDILPL